MRDGIQSSQGRIFGLQYAPRTPVSRALTPAGVQPQAPEGQRLSSQGSSKESQEPQSLPILHPKLALLQQSRLASVQHPSPRAWNQIRKGSWI